MTPAATYAFLQANKLSFADCIRAFATEQDEVAAAYVSAAVTYYHEEGALEFDDTAIVSEGEDPGAYVMCWRWVTNEQAGVDEE